MSANKIASICVCLGLIGNVSFGQEPIPKSGSAPLPPTAEAFEEAPPAADPTPYSIPETTTPEYVSDPGYYGGSTSEPVEESYFRRTWSKWKIHNTRSHKAPYQAYNHFKSDLKPREVVPPFCSPTWGYHETCWRQFPAVQPCPPNAIMTGKTKAVKYDSLATSPGLSASSRHVAQRAAVQE